ncbi:hypothetical protein GQF61_17325 [Sphingobacterium sp. DK4209]|uniref:HEPN domain-containing protein n=1 Tax=Sphingobacterium zhuxiongii TaxID=2662364 RepID=A0A5Q0QB50_9SPHI|nr:MULTISPECIES: hypothetical protein [unclassified Sphingobacterium]MVZ67610.1 hypothetical protein [Sphingobacterium sp. DK4209]QGA26696.1 hypothetical protein GFH32_10315 [Sphingobacterium sp. dk4302]
MAWNIKSQQSIEAADTLLRASHFGNSIHCSYYSVLQILYHIISEELGMTEEEINRGMTFDKSSSHKWIINKSIGLMRKLPIPKPQVLKLNSRINELKDNRVLADYGETLIDAHLARLSYNESQEIKDDLITIFKL